MSQRQTVGCRRVALACLCLTDPPGASQWGLNYAGYGYDAVDAVVGAVVAAVVLVAAESL